MANPRLIWAGARGRERNFFAAEPRILRRATARCTTCKGWQGLPDLARRSIGDWASPHANRAAWRRSRWTPPARRRADLQHSQWPSDGTLQRVDHRGHPITRRRGGRTCLGPNSRVRTVPTSLSWPYSADAGSLRRWIEFDYRGETRRIGGDREVVLSHEVIKPGRPLSVAS